MQTRARRPLVLGGVMLAWLCAGPLAGAGAFAQEAPATLLVGTQTLTRCGGTPLAYCGRLRVPLDYAKAQGPEISIAYRFYPASAPPAGGAVGTVLPVEGGPGYPSIGSVSYADGDQPGGYAAMYGPLLERFNMLAVDNRGTGSSTPLECHALQDFSGPTDSEAFQQDAGTCAQTLDHRWRYHGEWVHASDLFTSAAAAKDLAAVIHALELGQVDLYGDSYGSFFAQVFAARFPQLLRSVILDSTYETIGLDPWYRSTVAAMPADFDAACSRWQACQQAADGESSWAAIEALAARLRAQPIGGTVPGASGKRESVSMNSVGLVDLINDAAGDPHVYRELDAAARALLDSGYAAPLLRLYAQRLFEDESYFRVSASSYSAELYLAVSCLDYPQLFSMQASPAARAGELAAAQLALPARTFSPFSIEEWLEQDQNTEAYTACLDWPSPGPDVQPPIPMGDEPPLLPASLPVLVLGGELDTWTPPSGAPQVLAEIGGDARSIELTNSTHVVGEADTACGSEIVQQFVADPQALQTLDAACAPAVPPIHAVGVYAQTLAEEQPLAAAPGSSAPQLDLQLAAAAVSTAGDAISRYSAIEATLDHGLAGGSVSARRGGAVLELRRDQLIPGVAVSGTVTLSPAAGENGQEVLAKLTVRAAGVAHGSFTASWTTAGANAHAQVSGSVAEQPVSGSMLGP